jgi:hypothetical protein
MKYKSEYTDSWALIIGINKYEHVSPLEIARADAESIRGALVSQLNFPTNHVTILLDRKATRSRIFETFLSYDKLNQDDRLFVFFAGHGTTVATPKGQVGYLIPVNGKPGDKSTLIRWDDLTRNADVIPAKHILFVMDACYSGLAIQRSGTSGERRFVRDMLQRRSRQVITAGKANEKVADGGGPSGENSIFTGYLLEGLQGAAADDGGVIVASNLMNYAYKKVATDSRSEQTPHFGHIDGDGDFILYMPDSVAGGLDSASHDFLIKTPAERPEPVAHVDWAASTPGFAERNNYVNPESDSFGINEWSKRLGSASPAGCVRAFGWIALVIEPVTSESVVLDLVSFSKSLRGRSFGNFQQNQGFTFPRQALTTLRSLVLYDPAPGIASSDECWERFVRIERSGAMEYCDFDHVARPVKWKDDKTDYHVFLYVQLIGTIWTFVSAAKQVFEDAGYAGGIRLLINLTGTRDSILAEFAHAQGQNNQVWQQPFESGYFGTGNAVTNLRCRDNNLQFRFQLVLASLTDEDLKKVLVDCGDQLGLAYNHQSQPRCFPFGTTDFPWREYNPYR